jgi:hypothetical protein
MGTVAAWAVGPDDGSNSPEDGQGGDTRVLEEAM